MASLPPAPDGSLDSQPSDASLSDQFLTTVFPAELREIAFRRMEFGLPVAFLDLLEKDPTEPDAQGSADEPADAEKETRSQDRRTEEAEGHAVRPDVGLGLIGLSYSGGGIRSAAFNLGVTQAAVELGLMPRVDYLSTVSGGGYTGACVSAVMSDDRVDPKAAGNPGQFPLHFSYVPKGQMRTPGEYREPEPLKHLREHASYLGPRGALDLLRLPAIWARGALANLVVISLVPIVFGLLLALGLRWAPHEGTSPPHWAAQWLWIACLGAFVAVLFLLSAVMLPSLWSTRRKRDAFAGALVWLVLLASGISVLLLLPAGVSALAGMWRFTLESPRLCAAGAGVAVAVMGAARHFAASQSTTIRRGAVGALALIGPLALTLSTIFIAWYVWLGALNTDWLDHIAWLIHVRGWAAAWGDPPTISRIALVLLIGLVIGFWYFPRLDINSTSMHGIYRDRLSTAFLFGVDADGQVDDWGFERLARGMFSAKPRRFVMDELKLSDLARRPMSPYHLINAAVNLEGSRDISLRGRGADFFLFSKAYVGSETTGYCRTTAMEAALPSLNLGTAMAVSGAAAAPNMGGSTVRSATFLLGAMNVRLGLWIPNPGRIKESVKSVTRRLGVSACYLFNELLSRLSERAWRVNVTDGGHIENLGVYELLRRRCAVIVVSDAEADPGLTFASLAKVIRMARTDLGIDINLDVAPIRNRPNGYSAASHVIGDIVYPGGGPKGKILYMKSSLMGNEVQYVLHERSVDPSFPHTSTLNQMFTEQQFEAYRALGYHIAGRAIPECLNW